jgi:uncharacterized protein
MQNKTLQDWEEVFKVKAATLYPASDPSHDVLHIGRVVKTALRLGREEKADPNIVMPAAYFHDFVNVPKNDPRRKEASSLSAEAAGHYLAGLGYPENYLPAIRHAIAAHSFSASIKPETIEAKVVQDADRLDALGAIGIARCFSVSALMQTPYYCEGDVSAERRTLNDRDFALDHFPVKLFKIAETMQTRSAQREAAARVAFMKDYLARLLMEV